MPDAARLPGEIPIVIGVTRHRHLNPASAQVAAEAVHAVLEDLLQRHPHSEIVLLNALAVGADFLVACLALTLARVSLVALLPMPLEETRGDFTDPAVAELAGLRSGSKRSFDPISRDWQSRVHCLYAASQPAGHGRLSCTCNFPR